MIFVEIFHLGKFDMRWECIFVVAREHFTQLWTAAGISVMENSFRSHSGNKYFDLYFHDRVNFITDFIFALHFVYTKLSGFWLTTTFYLKSFILFQVCTNMLDKWARKNAYLSKQWILRTGTFIKRVCYIWKI